MVDPVRALRLITFRGRLMFLMHGFYFKAGLVPVLWKAVGTVSSAGSWCCQEPHTVQGKLQTDV